MDVCRDSDLLSCNQQEREIFNLQDRKLFKEKKNVWSLLASHSCRLIKAYIFIALALNEEQEMAPKVLQDVLCKNIYLCML